MIRVIKRDGSEVEFDKRRIYNAIFKAMKNGSGIVEKDIAEKVTEDIEEYIKENGKIWDGEAFFHGDILIIDLLVDLARGFSFLHILALCTTNALRQQKTGRHLPTCFIR